MNIGRNRAFLAEKTPNIRGKLRSPYPCIASVPTATFRICYLCVRFTTVIRTGSLGLRDAYNSSRGMKTLSAVSPTSAAQTDAATRSATYGDEQGKDSPAFEGRQTVAESYEAVPARGKCFQKSTVTNKAGKSRTPRKKWFLAAASCLFSIQDGCILTVMDEPLDTWFKREIVAHEEALVRYLTRSWPNRQEVFDLRQDIYVRVYEAAAKSLPQSPKSFLFATARHLMTDRIRRKRIVSIDAVGDLDALNVMIEYISPEERASAHQELRRLAQAIDLLPPKCREAVWMRRVDDLPQKEVAMRLGIAQKTVEKHVMKGMKLLAAALFRNERGRLSEDQARNSDDSEKEHGKP